MKTGPRAVVIAMYVGLSACAGTESTAPFSTATSVDLVRYAGTWYEIARLPMWFQRHCVDRKRATRVVLTAWSGSTMNV